MKYIRLFSACALLVIGIVSASAGDIIVHAHKNGIPQDIPAAVADYAISFPETKVNVGGAWDASTGILTLEPATYRVQISLNVVNPNNEGKYEAFLCRGINGQFPAQVGLQGSRMSGTSDTVYASNSIVVYGGLFRPCFQHSVVPSIKQIDGQEFASWLIVEKISNTVVNDPLRWGTTGPIRHVDNIGSYTYVERRNPIIKGATVTAIGNFSDVAGTFPLHIVRYRPNSVDVIRTEINVHDGHGYRDVPLSSQWIEPNDGYDYFVAAKTSGQSMGAFDGWPRSYAPGNISGNNVAVTDQDPGSGLYVVGVRATYLDE